MNINETLLKALFTDARPISHFNKIYQYLGNRIFPGKEQIIQFLLTDDHSERIGFAKEVIARMCLESNYPPPYELLIKLLDSEEMNDNKAAGEGGYTPQDHFVHILNLYLLGIYVFFYHPTFNKSLVNYFSNTRTEKTRSRYLTSAKDFISCWKYFCLFHDLSYPLEIASTGDHKQHESQILEMYYKIPSMLYREFSVEAIAKLYVADQLIDDYHNLTIKDLFEKLIYNTFVNGEDMLNSEKIIAKYKGFIGIDKLFIFDHLKIVLNFIPNNNDVLNEAKNNLLTVLIDVTTGNPIAFFWYDDNDDRKLYIVDTFDKDLVEKTLANYEYLQNEKYRIMYFVKNINTLMGKILNTCDIKENDFIKIKTILQQCENQNRNDKGNIPFYGIDSPQAFGKYLFQIYNIVSTQIKNIFFDGKRDIYDIPNNIAPICIENRRRVYGEYLNNDLIIKISDKISEYVKEDISRINNIEKNKILESGKKKAVSRELFLILKTRFELFTREFTKQLENVSDEAAEKICNDLNDKIEQTNVLATIFNNIRNELMRDIFYKEEDIKSSSFEKVFTSVIAKNNDISKIIKKIDRKFRTEHNGISFNEIIKYHGDHSRHDHGVCSCLCYLLCNVVSFNIIDNSDIKKEVKFLVWDVDARSDKHCKHKRKLIEKYNSIIENAASAIICHNIYPDNIKKQYGKHWMLTLNKSPFAYFCCLMDSLQIWHRPKYMVHSKHSWKPNFFYSNYNINVEGDQLVIRCHSRSKDYKKILDDMIGSLNSYLENCTDHISLAINLE
jgi:hypothetical protein